ncbi:unnamed protein product, partial [Discosporangium mesarthrocarpum]
AYLDALDLPKEELEMSIIGTVGDMDSPMPPDAKGWTSLRRHLLGHTDSSRQRFRDEVIETTAKDFSEFGERLSKLKETGGVAVVGSKAAFEAANANLPEESRLDVTDPFQQE